MALDLGIQLLKDVFMNTTFAGSYWVYQLLFLFGSLIIITRNYKDWSALALPIVTGWNYIGFKFNLAIFLIAGIAMVIDVFTLKSIEGGLTAIQEGITSGREKRKQRLSLFGTKSGKAIKYVEKERINKKRLDIADEMERLRKESEFRRDVPEYSKREKIERIRKIAKNVDDEETKQRLKEFRRKRKQKNETISKEIENE